MKVLLREIYSSLDIGLIGDSNVLLIGQTGSGKTYSCLEILDKSNFVFPLDVSCIEIYKDKLRDLLGNKNVVLENLELKNQSVIKAKNRDALTEILKIGFANRITKSTRMNNVSSRSHMLIFIGDRVFVDMAGSENLKKSESDKEECKFINQSLLGLSNCIIALEEKKPFIPWRSTVLTSILKSVILERETIFIGCVNPDNKNETKITKEYLKRIKKIDIVLSVKKEKKKVRIMEKIDKQDCAELKEELEKYKYLYESNDSFIKKFLS